MAASRSPELHFHRRLELMARDLNGAGEVCRSARIGNPIVEIRRSYDRFYNGISHTGKMASLNWIRALGPMIIIPIASWMAYPAAGIDQKSSSQIENGWIILRPIMCICDEMRPPWSNLWLWKPLSVRVTRSFTEYHWKDSKIYKHSMCESVYGGRGVSTHLPAFIGTMRKPYLVLHVPYMDICVTRIESSLLKIVAYIAHSAK